ncbi:MAG: transglutaminaseTgpA domain-containing protein, partial [Chloroflexota bacterium]
MRISSYPAVSRALAFLAVSSAIAAVSWSIQDFSLLAIGIPGLAAGHLYSWRRREASIRRSLILLLFMVLTVFLGGDILLSGLSDRLLLTRYLIYGLVLGSFDLMRKRNVMASVMLGALLMVLISELALNVWFLVFVVIFTILALMSAAVSRVEAETVRAVVIGEIKRLTAWKVWLVFAGAVVLVAAVFFLLLPRLASNQLTQANWLPSRLDLSLGGPLRLPSKPGASVAPGILPSAQEGESDGTSGRGTRRYTTLGYTGSYADTAVMQVRSQISSYWRGLTLDEYDGIGWLSSSGQVKMRNEGRGEFTLPDSKVGLSQERVYWQVYYILSDQPNAVFTGYNPGRIYLPGAGQNSLVKGTLYRALSSVPYLKPQLLRNDSVVSDDAANMKLPAITERAAALAESIVKGAATDYDKAARLERFLLTNYPYKLDIEPLPPGRDAVDFFLFEQQAGYCANFATAMAVMARHVGLPARVAAGYLPGLIDPLTGAHIVRVGDAHAWVEIHFQRQGWVAFDPTPRADAAMGFLTRRSRVHFGLEDFTGLTFAGMLSPLAGNLSLGSLSASALVRGILLAGAVTIIVLALRLIRLRLKTKQSPAEYSLLEGESRRTALNLYRSMVAILVRKGLSPRQSYQPPDEYAALVSRQIPAGQEIVERLTRLAIRAAYDPKPFNLPDTQELRRHLS